MPLSRTGRKLLNKFIKQYGKRKGKAYFHAWERKNNNKEFLLK